MSLFPNSSDAEIPLGSFDGHDLYFDSQGGTIPTVIARYGAAAHEYKSGMEFAVRGLDPHLVEARLRAIDRGLIHDSLKPTAP